MPFDTAPHVQEQNGQAFAFRVDLRFILLSMVVFLNCAFCSVSGSSQSPPVMAARKNNPCGDFAPFLLSSQAFSSKANCPSERRAAWPFHYLASSRVAGAAPCGLPVYGSGISDIFLRE